MKSIEVGGVQITEGVRYLATVNAPLRDYGDKETGCYEIVEIREDAVRVNYENLSPDLRGKIHTFELSRTDPRPSWLTTLPELEYRVKSERWYDPSRRYT